MKKAISQSRSSREPIPSSQRLPISEFIRPDIVAMKPYTPIVPFEVLSEQLNRPIHDIIKLDANENPYGPSPTALKMLQQGEFFHIYPDPEANQLRDALSEFTGVPKEYLLTGMGADELIDLILRVVLSPGDVVVDTPPSFGMYPFSTAVNAGEYVSVARSAEFEIDFEALETTVQQNPQTKVVFICSPNNPDGGVISRSQLERLLLLPALIVLDEAYIEFAQADGQPSYIEWVPEHDNLVVLRTFSKWAGLAGLRVGFGAFPHWLSEQIWKIKQPYNINVAANLAAIGSLKDADLLLEQVAQIVAERKRLIAALEPFGAIQPYTPTYSNFVLCKIVGHDAAQLKADLSAEGILVRYFAKPGVDNCIRISVGLPAQTDRLIEALRKIFNL